MNPANLPHLVRHSAKIGTTKFLSSPCAHFGKLPLTQPRDFAISQLHTTTSNSAQTRRPPSTQTLLPGISHAKENIRAPALFGDPESPATVPTVTAARHSSREVPQSRPGLAPPHILATAHSTPRANHRRRSAILASRSKKPSYTRASPINRPRGCPVGSALHPPPRWAAARCLPRHVAFARMSVRHILALSRQRQQSDSMVEHPQRIARQHVIAAYSGRKWSRQQHL